MTTGSQEHGSDSVSLTQVKSEEVDEALSMIGGTRRLVREQRRPFDPLAFDTWAASSTTITPIVPAIFSSSSTSLNQSAINTSIGIPDMQAEGYSEHMEGPHYGSLDWDLMKRSDLQLTTNNLGGGLSDDMSLFSTGDATQNKSQ